MAIVKVMKTWISRAGLCYTQMLCRREFAAQKFIAVNERPVEYHFVFKHLAGLCPRTVLDVGTGTTALPHLIRNCGFEVTAADNKSNFWPGGMVNRHYYIISDDITNTKLGKKFDLITCISVLEHIKNHKAALRSMFSLLNQGGHLILTFPFNDSHYAENVYMLPGSGVKEKYPFITQAFSRAELDSWIEENNATLVQQEYWRFFTGAYWTVGERICPPVKVKRDEMHQLTCILLRKR